ncbi:MAG: hypothetical protein CME70_03240 [Halobacteriovorax sp.]|nr:hypothetical protein [Halobacteriovorax sp.]MBK22998.1 hypothetical protein [Halobacteriovorax sp.]
MKSIKSILLVSSVFILLQGCSSHSVYKAMYRGAALGAGAGIAVDYAVKPDGVKYEAQHAVGSALIGAAVGAGVSYLFHKEDPSKNPIPRKREDEMRDEIQKSSQPDFDYELGNKKLELNLEFKKTNTYIQKTANLPSDLKALFPQPTLETHKLEPQVRTFGNETMLIRGCEVSVQSVAEPNIGTK